MKRLLAIVIASSALLVPAAIAPEAQAVDITITFTNATPAEVRASNWFLAKTNVVREAHGLEPYANIKELIVDRIKTTWISSWIQQQSEATQREQQVRDLWKDATDAQRAAAIAALQG